MYNRDRANKARHSPSEKRVSKIHPAPEARILILSKIKHSYRLNTRLTNRRTKKVIQFPIITILLRTKALVLLINAKFYLPRLLVTVILSTAVDLLICCRLWSLWIQNQHRKVPKTTTPGCLCIISNHLSEHRASALELRKLLSLKHTSSGFF